MRNAGDLGQAGGSHPSLPQQEKWPDKGRSPVLGQHGWPGSRDTNYSLWIIYWYPPCSVAPQVAGACASYGYSLASSLCPHVFFGYQMMLSKSGCRRGWREGREGVAGLSGASPAAAALLGRLGDADALPCATSARIYPGFFQHPPRSSLISCIQIFTFGLFVLPVFHSKVNASGVTSLAGEAPLFSPQDGQSPARALTTPFQAPSTLPREEPGAKRVSAWTAQSMCPFSAEAARLLAIPVGRYSGGCWECSRSQVPVQQR